MKRQLIYVALIASVINIASHLCVPIAVSKEESDWYPFVLAEKLAPSSPANIGKLVLDPPAGKHGFVKAKDGHFYFENGTRARFWGTNLCFNACFPSKEQAEIIADRLAFFGFNAVRLHHMDFDFEPRGIFEDIYPAYKHPQAKQTGTLSKTQLDKLDYLIYQLKQRGIYVDMNLLVTRHFTEADGVKDAEKLDTAAKPVSMFDPKLIELQKRYAKDLLTHYNPYTKLRYRDDPTVALVEITNENSIFNLKNKPIPGYYRKQLKDLWNNWLKANNQTQRKTKTDFYLFLEKKYFKEMTDFLKKDCKVKVPITGSQYSSPSAQVSCDFIDTHAYWDHPRFPNKAWDANDFRIHNRSMLKNEKLGIIGSVTQKQQADSSTNNKPFTITEWNHCYPNQYAYETPVLIAAEAVKNGWDGLFQFAFTHGEDLNTGFNNIHSYFDIIANPQQLILCSLGSLIFHNAQVEISAQNDIFRFNSPHIEGIAGLIKDVTCDLGPATVRPNSNCTIFLYSSENKPIEDSNALILIALSEVKNKDSGWKKEKFKWGTKPTMLKNVDIEISLPGDKEWEVCEIAPDGTKGRQIVTSQKDNKLTFSTKRSNSPLFLLMRN
jgi:hypothetical protein